MNIRYFKKTLLAALLCSSAFAGSFMSEHRMAGSIDPISWTTGNFNLQYELSMNDRLSFNVPIGFGFNKAVFQNNYFAGGYFAPQVGVKYYVTGKATDQGFYINPLLGLFVGKGAAATFTNTTAGLTYEFRFGYAWNIWKGLWLDSYFGYQGLATKFNSDNDALKYLDFPQYTVTPFKVGIMFGYAF